MLFDSELGRVLRNLMQRAGYAYTPGLLSKLSGVPKTTIVHWLEGRVSRPRYWQDLARVADALRLSELEASLLLHSAGHPSIQELRAACRAPQDQALLAVWPARDEEQALPFQKLPTTIPFPGQPLVGQAHTFATATTLLRAGWPRLLLISGPGGVGKSLLAAHVARAVQDSFADGVVWVVLDRLTQAAQVLPALAESIGVPVAGHPISAATLGARLSERRMLLILDTFEHLVAAVPEVLALLACAPQLTVALTSRRRLALPGAFSLHVEPLDVPASHVVAAPAQIAEFAAVALFVQRAQLVCPSFALTPANAADVATLCACLDGLPLAIELAAARLKILSPRELLTRLQASSASDRLQLLANGKRNAPARQQTLRDSISWSYQLLGPESRRLLGCLAAHDATVSLAQASGPFSAAESAAVLSDALQALVDHHLARLVAPDSAQPGLLLPAFVRDYIHTQLEPGVAGAIPDPPLRARAYEG